MYICLSLLRKGFEPFRLARPEFCSLTTMSEHLIYPLHIPGPPIRPGSDGLSGDSENASKPKVRGPFLRITVIGKDKLD